MIGIEQITLEEHSVHKGVYTLTFNRPNSLNAFTTQMSQEIIKVLDYLSTKEDIRVLVMTGKGDKSFCVGADLKERNGMTDQQWKAQHEIFEEMAEKIRRFDYPVIAAINGFALGGGLEMALSADIRFASSHATLGLPESKLGIIPGIGGTQLLSRLIPVGLAKEMLFRGNRVTAVQAKGLGLVNEVFESDKLLEETYKMAKEMAANAPLSLKMLKKVVDEGLQVSLDKGLSIELQYYYQCANSEDRLEGVKAFAEKRTPVWKGV